MSSSVPKIEARKLAILNVFCDFASGDAERCGCLEDGRDGSMGGELKV